MAGEQLVDRGLRDEAAPVEDRDAIADALDVGEDVGAHEDGRRAPEAADELEDVAAALGVERAHGLVEEEDRGPGEHRLPHAEPLAHAARVAADPASPGLGEADDLEDLLHPRREGRPRQAVGPPGEREELAAGHPAVEAGVLVEVPDLPGEGRPVPVHRDPGHLGPARRGPGEAAEQPQRRRLAGPVRAEEAED